MLTLLLALFLPASASAAMLHYKVNDLDFAAMLQRVESQTGLVLEARCAPHDARGRPIAPPTCDIHGGATYDGATLTITIYEQVDKRDPRIKKVQYTKELARKITAAVLQR